MPWSGLDFPFEKLSFETSAKALKGPVQCWRREGAQRLLFLHFETAQITLPHTYSLRHWQARRQVCDNPTQSQTRLYILAQCSPYAKPSAIQHRSTVLRSDILLFVFEKESWCLPSFFFFSTNRLFVPQDLKLLWAAEVWSKSAFQEPRGIEFVLCHLQLVLRWCIQRLVFFFLTLCFFNVTELMKKVISNITDVKIVNSSCEIWLLFSIPYSETIQYKWLLNFFCFLQIISDCRSHNASTTKKPIKPIECLTSPHHCTVVGCHTVVGGVLVRQSLGVQTRRSEFSGEIATSRALDWLGFPRHWRQILLRHGTSCRMCILFF